MPSEGHTRVRAEGYDWTMFIVDRSQTRSGGSTGLSDVTALSTLSTTSLVGMLTMPFSLPRAAFGHRLRAATLLISLGNCQGTNLNSAKDSTGKQKAVLHLEELGSTVYSGLLRLCLLLLSPRFLWVRNFHCILPRKSGGHAPAGLTP